MQVAIMILSLNRFTQGNCYTGVTPANAALLRGKGLRGLPWVKAG